ncbi:hypothetical protein LJC20_00365 [Eubacteriales bacterium OttesenSCG-928-M02]|nr:hypothetical protein [Eubacteriales bacterium OttesenSCG-928-M02]
MMDKVALRNQYGEEISMMDAMMQFLEELQALRDSEHHYRMECERLENLTNSYIDYIHELEAMLPDKEEVA